MGSYEMGTWQTAQSCASSAWVRVAAIGIATGGWVHVGCPVDALVVALLWAVLTACLEHRSASGQSWLCEHHAVVVVGTLSLAIATRKTPASEGWRWAMSCSWVVGELCGRLASGWFRSLPTPVRGWRLSRPAAAEQLGRGEAGSPRGHDARLRRAAGPAACAPAAATQPDDEPSFWSIQFVASFPFVMGMIVVLMLFCLLFCFEEVTPVTSGHFSQSSEFMRAYNNWKWWGLVGSTGLIPVHVVMARYSIVVGCLALAIRAGLHRMHDQDQARLYMARAWVALETARQLSGLKNAVPGNATSLSFMVGRLMVFLYHAFAGCKHIYNPNPNPNPKPKPKPNPNPNPNPVCIHPSIRPRASAFDFRGTRL